ncbi:MAG: phospholipid carrier-dependent glycosyltransferase [Rhodobacteraceae bacterium]|nr:phospholipid carrier-dependent glycosyltransferase [Paracoccaceae bacterium]
MVETQDWITPQFQYGVPFWGKPPLHTWLSAAGMEIFGVNAFGARALILVCAIAILWMLFVFVRDELGRNAALVSLVILSSSLLFFGAAAFVMTDLAMTLGIVITMVSVWRVLNNLGDKNLNGLLVFAGLVIGLLAKGPVAVVLCGIPLVLWGLFTRRWRDYGKLPWIRGFALLLVLAAPWYIAAEIKTPGFLNYFIIGEHYERFIIPDWQGDLYGNGHERPKGAIWMDWVLAFLPWSLAFVPMLFKPRAIQGAFENDTTGWRLYLLMWAISPMILFTPAANILAAYTLPGLPAAAILLVCLYCDLWGRVPGKPVRLAVASFTSLIIVVGATYAVLAKTAPHSINLRSERELVAKRDELAPQLPLYYFGNRSYSAEFYTKGQARMIPDLIGLDALANTDHALAIHHGTEARLVATLAPTYERVGRFGRHVLYLHRLVHREGSK